MQTMWHIAHGKCTPVKRAHRASKGLRSHSNKLIAWHFWNRGKFDRQQSNAFCHVPLWHSGIPLKSICPTNRTNTINESSKSRGISFNNHLQNMFSETAFDQLQCIPNFSIPKCPAADKVKIARWLTSKCSVQCPFLYRRQKRWADQWALCPSSVITNSLSLSSSPICKRYNREHANFITSSAGDCNERTPQEHKAHSGDQSISRMCANDLRAPFHFVSLRLQNEHWVPILQSPS